MPDRFGKDLTPEQLSDHRGRLHRAIQRAVREQRQAQVKRSDVDETGRTWPGLITPPEKPDQ